MERHVALHHDVGHEPNQQQKILVDSCAASSACPPWFGANCSTTPHSEECRKRLLEHICNDPEEREKLLRLRSNEGLEDRKHGSKMTETREVQRTVTRGRT
eukprot:2841356-Amphidinium_carterae.2